MMVYQAYGTPVWSSCFTRLHFCHYIAFSIWKGDLIFFITVYVLGQSKLSEIWWRWKRMIMGFKVKIHVFFFSGTKCQDIFISWCLRKLSFHFGLKCSIKYWERWGVDNTDKRCHCHPISVIGFLWVLSKLDGLLSHQSVNDMGGEVRSWWEERRREGSMSAA